MNTPEHFRDAKPEITDEEKSQLDALEAAAEAARRAGVYDPSEEENREM